eukprot:TRINITY_DN31469_c0_g1_i1.p2 TRINITY_DN31469_c0_g1~~TRINITY_DN31469_c0_g1_i1.p2  ORF type:complete len:205 (+),score=34.73 TRINITY_DN31469_c0_g1_i1:3-617(+)
MRTDVTELHTKNLWKSKLRIVRKGEQPVKQVIGALTNQSGAEKLSDLYGIWQTDPLVNRLNEDGTLPRNEYNNFEVCNGTLPAGTCHINLQGLPRLLRKHNIEFVEAVVGFEYGKHGARAVKGGVVAFEKDKETILKLHAENLVEIEKREREKERKAVMNKWREVFKAIIVRKYMKDNFDAITCLLYTSPSPRDGLLSRMPSSA